MAGIEHTTKIKVAFCDLDPMNIVWHGNYLKYLEIAREELFNSIGYGYVEMHKDKVMYPIAKMDLRFISPIEINQTVFVKCKPEEIEPAIIIKYEIKDEFERVIFKATSMQICVNTETKETLYEAPFRLKKIWEKL